MGSLVSGRPVEVQVKVSTADGSLRLNRRPVRRLPDWQIHARAFDRDMQYPGGEDGRAAGDEPPEYGPERLGSGEMVSDAQHAIANDAVEEIESVGDASEELEAGELSEAIERPGHAG